MIYECKLELRQSMKVWIDLVDPNSHPYDAVSIQTYNPEGSGFDSGVITVKKANIKSSTPVAVSATGVTITAPGVTELALADYGRAHYLVLDVTTPCTGGTTIIEVAVSLKRFGFAIELDGGGA